MTDFLTERLEAVSSSYAMASDQEEGDRTSLQKKDRRRKPLNTRREKPASLKVVKQTQASAESASLSDRNDDRNGALNDDLDNNSQNGLNVRDEPDFVGVPVHLLDQLA